MSLQKSISRKFTNISFSIWFITAYSGIYPSSFANVRFWKKIEFSNVIFHEKDHKISLQLRWGSGDAPNFTVGPRRSFNGGLVSETPQKS